MKWNRRELIKSAVACSAAPLIDDWPARAQSPPGPANTVFFQGALGGGGYACGINISPDGLTRTVRCDTYGAVVWDSASQTWKQVMKSPNMDAAGVKWPIGGNCYEIAVAPSDSARIYMAATNFNNGKTVGANNAVMGWYTIYRSDDRGASWSATSMTTFQCSLGNRLSGPKVRVDPNNPDIVYAGNIAGIFFVTYNAGRHWTRIDPLLDALDHARANAAVSPPKAAIPLNSNPVTTAIGKQISAGGTVYAYDADTPLAVGSNGDYDKVTSGNENAIRIIAFVEPPGVKAGDRIYFGLGSLVAIDGASGTVANPGIALGVPGAAGVASKNVYFGWSWGAKSIWWSQDGGSTFSPMPGTTPFQPRHFKVSNDAALAGGGGNVLYVSDGSPNSPPNRNGWRYVSAPPKGSSLAANTWTNLPQTLAPGIAVICPDPTNLGHCAYVLGPGNLALSKNYGEAAGGIYRNAPINASGSSNGVADPPWLAYTQQGYHSMGDAEYDTKVSGKLWLCEGIGVWYTTPTYNSARPTWYSQTAGIDSLTVQRIVKAPKPNNRILVGCQDRPFFSLKSPTVYPDKDHPFVPPSYNGFGPINHAGDIIYSDSDPSVVWGSTGRTIWRSTDNGDTWTQVAVHGSKGFIGIIGNCILASLSPSNCMAQPSNDGSAPIQYTADGGATWQPSLYLGKPLVATGNTTYQHNRKDLTSDGIGTYYYYDLGGGGILYKSTDGGATLTKVDMATPLKTGGGGSISGVLACVPGFQNHLFYAPGGNFGQVGGAIPLSRTIDGGVNWSVVPGTVYIQQVAFGKPKPGNSYPAVYITGSLTFPYNPGVFRSDDVLANGSTTMTWTRLDHIRFVNCNGARSLSGDPDTYGTVYVGNESSGYCVGKLQ